MVAVCGCCSVPCAAHCYCGAGSWGCVAMQEKNKETKRWFLLNLE